MSSCCICGNDANHPTKSYHCKIENDVYHYCYRHSYVGKRLVEKYIAREIFTEDQVKFWREIKRKYL